MAGSPIAGPEIRLRTKDGLIVRTQGGGKSVDEVVDLLVAGGVAGGDRGCEERLHDAKLRRVACSL